MATRRVFFVVVVVSLLIVVVSPELAPIVVGELEPLVEGDVAAVFDELLGLAVLLLDVSVDGVAAALPFVVVLPVLAPAFDGVEPVPAVVPLVPDVVPLVCAQVTPNVPASAAAMRPRVNLLWMVFMKAPYV